MLMYVDMVRSVGICTLILMIYAIIRWKCICKKKKSRTNTAYSLKNIVWQWHWSTHKNSKKNKIDSRIILTKIAVAYTSSSCTSARLMSNEILNKKEKQNNRFMAIVQNWCASVVVEKMRPSHILPCDLVYVERRGVQDK